jgi:type I restriction enzyme S subunit
VSRIGVLQEKATEFQQKKVAEPFSHTVVAPKTWAKSTLGEVVDFIGGSQPPKSKFMYEEKPDSIRLIQI